MALSKSVRRALTVAALLGPMAALGVFSMAQDGGHGGNQPASRVYKNIRVLKSVDAREIIPIMRRFNDSLGVKCDFCHVVTADHKGFERDDKRMKNKAREMITMSGDLNAKYRTVDRKVTCMMCHRGHAEPETGGRDSGRDGDRPGGRDRDRDRGR